MAWTSNLQNNNLEQAIWFIRLHKYSSSQELNGWTNFENAILAIQKSSLFLKHLLGKKKKVIYAASKHISISYKFHISTHRGITRQGLTFMISRLVEENLKWMQFPIILTRHTTKIQNSK